MLRGHSPRIPERLFHIQDSGSIVPIFNLKLASWDLDDRANGVAGHRHYSAPEGLQSDRRVPGWGALPIVIAAM